MINESCPWDPTDDSSARIEAQRAEEKRVVRLIAKREGLPLRSLLLWWTGHGWAVIRHKVSEELIAWSLIDDTSIVLTDNYNERTPDALVVLCAGLIAAGYSDWIGRMVETTHATGAGDIGALYVDDAEGGAMRLVGQVRLVVAGIENELPVARALVSIKRAFLSLDGSATELELVDEAGVPYPGEHFETWTLDATVRLAPTEPLVGLIPG